MKKAYQASSTADKPAQKTAGPVKAYIAGKLEKTFEIEAFGVRSTVAFSGMADGCIGVMLVFSNKKKAKKYSSGRPIIDAEVSTQKIA